MVEEVREMRAATRSTLDGVMAALEALALEGMPRDSSVSFERSPFPGNGLTVVARWELEECWACEKPATRVIDEARLCDEHTVADVKVEEEVMQQST